MRVCPACHHEWESRSQECPACGQPIAPNASLVPSPQEIHAATLEIQSKWTRREELKHRCGAYRPQRWTPVVCSSVLLPRQLNLIE